LRLRFVSQVKQITIVNLVLNAGEKGEGGGKAEAVIGKLRVGAQKWFYFFLYYEPANNVIICVNN